MAEEYDLAIIGAGSAGLTAAGFAAQLGVRLVLLEEGRIGGDCTWTGCVPSKTLLRTARLAHQMRVAGKYGLKAVNPKVDIKEVMSRIKEIIAGIYEEEAPEALLAAGIETRAGGVRFIDPHTVAVGDTKIEARRFLIATGARPFVPPVSGLEGVDYLTYETVWDMEELPERLLVLGAGPIGCEMAQAFSRLGSRVTLIEAGDRVLPRDDRAASEVIAGVFGSEEIDLHFNAAVEKAWQDGDGIHLSAGDKVFTGDALLVVVGRRPNVDNLDLERAGVEYNTAGIKVDGQLRTSQKHIYAAGDCSGGYQFTHYASWQATIAVRNALLPGSASGIREQVPWTTFTDPEVAHCGLNEVQAREKFGDSVMTCQWPMEKVDRARTEADTSGFLKLVHKKDGTLLGATVVCGRAGEVIHEWITALECGLKVDEMTEMIHVYPTYSIAGQQAVADIRMTRLLGGMSGRLIRGAVRLMR